MKAKHPLSFGNINPRPTVDLMFSLFYKSNPLHHCPCLAFHAMNSDGLTP